MWIAEISRNTSAPTQSKAKKLSPADTPNRIANTMAINHTNFMWVTPPFFKKWDFAIFIIAFYLLFVKKTQKLIYY